MLSQYVGIFQYAFCGSTPAALFRTRIVTGSTSPRPWQKSTAVQRSRYRQTGVLAQTSDAFIHTRIRNRQLPNSQCPSHILFPVDGKERSISALRRTLPIWKCSMTRFSPAVPGLFKNVSFHLGSSILRAVKLYGNVENPLHQKSSFRSNITGQSRSSSAMCSFGTFPV